jgi:hypothetical protein
VEGGEITGVVVEEAAPTGGFANKHIGGVKFEEVTITANLSLDPALYNWIADTWNRKYSRKDGRISTLDYNYRVISEVDFFNALITEVTIPKLDGSSKDACALTVKFSPEYTRHKKGSGAKMKIPAKGQQKVWHASNFRLTIDGLDCRRVSRVDALTVKQTVTRDSIGNARDSLTEPVSLEFPNLVVTLPEIDDQTWVDWNDDFLVKGNNSDEQEKNGTLEFLSADLKTTLGKVDFAHLGIFRLSRDKVEAGSEQVRTFTASMYVEAMKFTLGA